MPENLNIVREIVDLPAFDLKFRAAYDEICGEGAAYEQSRDAFIEAALRSPLRFLTGGSADVRTMETIFRRFLLTAENGCPKRTRGYSRHQTALPMNFNPANRLTHSKQGGVEVRTDHGTAIMWASFNDFKSPRVDAVTQREGLGVGLLPEPGAPRHGRIGSERGQVFVNVLDTPPWTIERLDYSARIFLGGEWFAEVHQFESTTDPARYFIEASDHIESVLKAAMLVRVHLQEACKKGWRLLSTEEKGRLVAELENFNILFEHRQALMPPTGSTNPIIESASYAIIRSELAEINNLAGNLQFIRAALGDNAITGELQSDVFRDAAGAISERLNPFHHIYEVFAVVEEIAKTVEVVIPDNMPQIEPQSPLFVRKGIDLIMFEAITRAHNLFGSSNAKPALVFEWDASTNTIGARSVSPGLSTLAGFNEKAVSVLGYSPRDMLGRLVFNMGGSSPVYLLDSNENVDSISFSFAPKKNSPAKKKNRVPPAPGNGRPAGPDTIFIAINGQNRVLFQRPPVNAAYLQGTGIFALPFSPLPPLPVRPLFMR